MHKLDKYITVGAKRMRCGYTTGTCAAAATRAAAELLFNAQHIPLVRINVPAGIEVDVDIESYDHAGDFAECSVRKDSGDDPDVTDGAFVFARVERVDAPGVHIEGGIGVGRVTREGLDQPVGNAAINSVPRKMIAEQVEEALKACGDAHDDSRGVLVTISIPAGVELAKKTFNPRLGIEGGISVLGTSGIVRPMSEEALIASIELECSMLYARGVRDVLVCPGNYGRDYARDVLGLDIEDCVQCSNYIGATLDCIVAMGFTSVLIVGHIGKMVKVASGAMNTHSRVSDARLETFAAHAAVCGASSELAARLLESATTDAALDLLDEADLLEPVMASVMEKLELRLRHRAGEDVRIEALVFSNVHGMLGVTDGAGELLNLHRADGTDE